MIMWHQSFVAASGDPCTLACFLFGVAMGVAGLLEAEMGKVPEGEGPSFSLRHHLVCTTCLSCSLLCRLPPDQRRGYKNVFNALVRITREEGVMTLWRVSLRFDWEIRICTQWTDPWSCRRVYIFLFKELTLFITVWFLYTVKGKNSCREISQAKQTT